MTVEEKNTKDKILEVANELFAKKGYDGTSVREIAKIANVNLAAINYHFDNKENLYWCVFNYNYEWIKSNIEQLAEKNLNTANLAIEVFRFFISSGSAIMNTFKIFLSNNIQTPNDELWKCSGERFGPPGQDAFIQSIQKDLGKDIPLEGCFWATKMIFSLIVHNGVVMNTSIMKAKCQVEPHLSKQEIENSIVHSVKAHLEYLKNNSQFWKA